MFGVKIHFMESQSYNTRDTYEINLQMRLQDLGASSTPQCDYVRDRILVQPIIQDQYRNSLSGPHQNIERTSAPYWIVSRQAHNCTHHSYFSSRISNYIIIHDKVLLSNRNSQIFDYLPMLFN